MNQSNIYKTKLNLLLVLLILIVMAAVVIAADANRVLVNEPTSGIVQSEKSEKFVDYGLNDEVLLADQEDASFTPATVKSNATFNLRRLLPKPNKSGGVVITFGYGWSD